MTHFTLRLIPAAAAACLLASCGGGGGTAPGDYPGADGNASTGVAVDGYLSGATVLCDADGNGLPGEGERAVGTNASGAFRFAPPCEDSLAVYGGTNVDTGLPFVGTLRAPAGAAVVSPLSTLLDAGLTQDQLRAAFGIAAGVDLLRDDPAETNDGALVRAGLLKRNLVAQQLMQKLAETYAALAGKSAAADVRAIYAVVAEAFAEVLADGVPLVSGNDVDDAVVAALVAQATPKAAAVFAFGETINAATLARVIKAALSLQAETLLKAPAGELATVTAEVQGSGRIAAFVLSVADQLGAAPGPFADALSVQLLAQFDPYLTVVDNTIRLVNGSTTNSYTLAQFQSSTGIAVAWPLPEPMALEVSVGDPGNYQPTPGQTVSAAISITEAGGGEGQVLAFIDKVKVERSTFGLKVTVPTNAAALAYGVSSDGSKRAVVNFREGVAGVTNTLRLGGTGTNSIAFGSVVEYTINQLSNDFSGIRDLRGTYNVSIVLSGLPLRQADGSTLPAVTVRVPTALTSTGAVATSRTVTGRGIVGTVRLTD